MAISPFNVIQNHRLWYRSKAHMRLPIKMIARQVLHIKCYIYESATEFAPCSYKIFIQ